MQTTFLLPPFQTKDGIEDGLGIGCAGLIEHQETMVVGARDEFQIVGGVVPGFTKSMGNGDIGVKMTAPDRAGSER